jgi:hypothetical protein
MMAAPVLSRPFISAMISAIWRRLLLGRAFFAPDKLTAIMIEITVLKEEINEPPAPGTAPWAPYIVYAPRPRWPVIIPLGLLAGLVAGGWLLLERGFLPHIGQFAGWS